MFSFIQIVNENLTNWLSMLRIGEKKLFIDGKKTTTFTYY
jgi:hypothetical protein